MKYVLCVVVVLFANVAVAQYPIQGYPPPPLAPVVPQLSQPPMAPIVPPTAEGFREGWREVWVHEFRPLNRLEDRRDHYGEWQMNPYGQYQRNLPPNYQPSQPIPIYPTCQPAPVYYQPAPMCPPQQRYYQPRTSWW